MASCCRKFSNSHQFKELEPDQRLLRIHYDWVQAGEVTQRTISRLSEQLRRYLDDKAWLDNRRIMQLMREIEQSALALRDPDAGGRRERTRRNGTRDQSDDGSAIVQSAVAKSDRRGPTDAVAPTAHNRRNFLAKSTWTRLALLPLVRKELPDPASRFPWPRLIAAYPLEHGPRRARHLSGSAAEDETSIIDDVQRQTLMWHEDDGHARQATLPLVIFCQPVSAKPTELLR